MRSSANFACIDYSEVRLHDLPAVKHAAAEKRLEGSCCGSYPSSMPRTRRSEARLGGACPERLTLGYFGVDPLNPMEAGHTHAVVAIADEVSPTESH